MKPDFLYGCYGNQEPFNQVIFYAIIQIWKLNSKIRLMILFPY